MSKQPVHSSHDADGVVHEVRVLKWYERTRVALGDFPPSLTQQSFQAECDINNIVKRQLATANPLPPLYGDFTEVPDFQTSQDLVLAANAAFMAQPSSLRARFSNNPAEFMAFVSDPANREEMRFLGLLKPEATPPASPVSEPPPAPPPSPTA